MHIAQYVCFCARFVGHCFLDEDLNTCVEIAFVR